jgi:hypothetical protein
VRSSLQLPKTGMRRFSRTNATKRADSNETKRADCILQLGVYCMVHMPAWLQGIMTSSTTLKSCSNWHEHGKFKPILAAIRSHHIKQLAIFVECPVTRIYHLPVDAGFQRLMPSHLTLTPRLIRYETNDGMSLFHILKLYSSSVVPLTTRLGVRST